MASPVLVWQTIGPTEAPLTSTRLLVMVMVLRIAALPTWP
jgi:hypothetical protein